MKKLVFVLLLWVTTSAVATCTGFVRLTFDDGPSTQTERVLDILLSKGIKATFFVLGSRAADQRSTIIRTVKEGHRVENHTWSHPDLTQLPSADRIAELMKTSNVIKEITGFAPTEWRPPYELWNPEIQTEALSLGMIMTLWSYSTDSEDWRGIPADMIVEKIVGGAVHGSIILMHDTYENSLNALPGVIDGVRGKGLCFAK